jgi:hypothetical protein
LRGNACALDACAAVADRSRTDNEGVKAQGAVKSNTAFGRHVAGQKDAVDAALTQHTVDGTGL